VAPAMTVPMIPVTTPRMTVISQPAAQGDSYERLYITSLHERIMSLEQTVSNQNTIIHQLIAMQSVRHIEPVVTISQSHTEPPTTVHAQPSSLVSSRPPPGPTSTTVAEPTKSAEQWQVQKPATRHITGIDKSPVSLQNRFAPLASNQDEDEAIAAICKVIEQREAPLTKSTPGPVKTSFHPNRQPENQTLPSRPQSARQPSSPNLPAILVAGDSIIKNVTSWQIRENLRKNGRRSRLNVSVKPFLGAQVRSMPLYLEAALQEVDKPDYVVAHVGTNDIHAGRSTNEIREDFRKLNDYLKNKGIFLIISLLTCRSDNHRDDILRTNHMLIELADELGIGYSGNENINDEHLNQSRYHLKTEGSQVLATNLSNTINSIFGSYDI